MSCSFVVGRREERGDKMISCSRVVEDRYPSVLTRRLSPTGRARGVCDCLLPTPTNHVRSDYPVQMKGSRLITNDWSIEEPRQLSGADGAGGGARKVNIIGKLTTCFFVVKLRTESSQAEIHRAVFFTIFVDVFFFFVFALSLSLLFLLRHGRIEGRGGERGNSVIRIRPFQQVKEKCDEKRRNPNREKNR